MELKDLSRLVSSLNDVIEQGGSLYNNGTCFSLSTNGFDYIFITLGDITLYSSEDNRDLDTIPLVRKHIINGMISIGDDIIKKFGTKQ